MARKRKSNSALIVVAAVIGFIIAIPPEAWGGMAAIGLAAFVFWRYMNAKKAEPTGPSPNPFTQQSTSRSSPPTREAQVRSKRPNLRDDDLTSFRLDGISEKDEFRIPNAPADTLSANWVPPGKGIEIQNFSIPRGMLYVGSPKRNEYGQRNPAVIDPKLKVAAREIDWSESLTSYWPSYSDISPEARRAYLQWLADGRKAPEADISYPFLFFYGLERRILIDLPNDSTVESEIRFIAAEVKRLLSIYAENNSFRRYASHFLEYLEAAEATPASISGPPPDLEPGRHYELPLKLKIGLGQFALTQTPLRADWALAWALSDPNIRRRTPVERCTDEFAQLFKRHYAQSHGEGILLKRNRTKLKHEYHPASNALGGYRFRKELGDIPDVSAVRTPVQKLQALVDECTAELEPYSRFIGRNPDKAHALEGLLQLPIELWPAEVQSELDLLKQRIGEGMVLMSFGELSGLLKSAGPLSRDKVLGLCRALESLNVGMEPDVLSGRKPPKPEDKIALFATHLEDGNVRSAPAYQAAAVTLDLACMALYADGEVSAHELVALTKQIDSWTHLSAAHRKRLKAHLRLGIDQPLTLASVKKQLEPLATEARRSIARLLAHLTQADGVVAPSEVKFLERAYKLLGLDTQLVYSDLHASDPLPPSSAATRSGHTEQQAAEPKGFTLDPARIAQLEKETAEVSALLAGVFVEEESASSKATEEDPSAAEMESDEPEILGLNADDAAFLRVLVTRSSWPREDLADVAADMELMLDGTLDHINDAAFEAFDGPLTEGDDPIEINPEILEALPV